MLEDLSRAKPRTSALTVECALSRRRSFATSAALCAQGQSHRRGQSSATPAVREAQTGAAFDDAGPHLATPLPRRAGDRSCHSLQVSHSGMAGKSNEARSSSFTLT
mmetsp:Transcript_46823/g.109331  ORF Transcript_46823/g.109331 Transcript_46823/m.109331 type:complete len:106 (+) Transcript_46823:80-397(+)